MSKKERNLRRNLPNMFLGGDNDETSISRTSSICGRVLLAAHGTGHTFWYLALSNRIRLPVSWATAVSFQGYRQSKYNAPSRNDGDPPTQASQC